MRSLPRGIALLAALMISTVLFVLGMGFLGQRRGQSQAAREYLNQSQASALADAGLQDALGKLAKDVGFPPLRSDDQGSFVYSEEVFDSSNVSVGHFRVTIDTRYMLRPYEVLRVTSVGMLGDPKAPSASVSRRAEIDINVARQPFQILYVTTNEDE